MASSCCECNAHPCWIFLVAAAHRPVWHDPISTVTAHCRSMVLKYRPLIQNHGRAKHTLDSRAGPSQRAKNANATVVLLGRFHCKGLTAVVSLITRLFTAHRQKKLPLKAYRTMP